MEWIEKWVPAVFILGGVVGIGLWLHSDIAALRVSMESGDTELREMVAAGDQELRQTVEAMTASVHGLDKRLAVVEDRFGLYIASVLKLDPDATVALSFPTAPENEVLQSD